MAQDAKTLDLIAVGRSSVDLYGQQVGGRLEDMGSFAKYLGGSPTNTAAGGARLGLKTGLLTRVGADHMGRFIREQLEREGVDHVFQAQARLAGDVLGMDAADAARAQNGDVVHGKPVRRESDRGAFHSDLIWNKNSF